MNDKIIISQIKGGFGNQLNQYGTGLRLALKLNAELKVDLSFYTQDKYKNMYKLDEINVIIEKASADEIKMLKNKPNAPLFYRVLNKLGVNSKYKKKTDIADIISFKPDYRLMNLNHSAYISGWCAKEAYFREIKPILAQQFQPIRPLSQDALQYSKTIAETQSVSIHIRRGDYIDLQHFFKVMPIEYYKGAVAYISKKIKDPMFFIFSNDIKWAKSNMNFIDNSVFIDLTSCLNYTGLADLEEFELMKKCKNNIIGNSSFSWWSAYLNSNSDKVVIAPKIWYNDDLMQKSFEKYPICPLDWILI